MNYLELIYRFWDFNKKIQLGSTAIAMYLYLLQRSSENKCHGVTISDVALRKQLGLTRKTVKSTKEKLEKIGPITNAEKKTTTNKAGRILLILFLK